MVKRDGYFSSMERKTGLSKCSEQDFLSGSPAHLGVPTAKPIKIIRPYSDFL